MELRSPQSAATRSHRPPRPPDGRDITAGNQPQAASPHRRVTPAATAFSIVASVDWTRASRRMRRCAGTRLTDALLHSPEAVGKDSAVLKPTTADRELGAGRAIRRRSAPVTGG